MKTRGRPRAWPVDTLADLLARAVGEQWRRAALEGRLLESESLPLRWSPTTLPAARSVPPDETPPGPPEFPPLSGQIGIGEHDPRVGGGRAELYDSYAGLVSGRIVILGAPGVGKSASAILLLLDALAHRARIDDSVERARVPVPVLLTAYRWNPTKRSLHEWLRDEFAATYPLFDHSEGPAKAAALVAAPGKITLILEGLDEMDPAPRRAALRALRDAPFRVAALTRGGDTLQMISDTWPAGVLTVRVDRVTAAAATDYLRRSQSGPRPSGWSDLLANLAEQPGGVLARGLSTPLALELLRDTYQVGDDVRELLDATRFGDPEAIERYLIARVLPTAYAPRPGRPPPRYTEARARRTLSFLAWRMGKDRDLLWWGIRRWAPRTPRVLSAGLGGGLLVGFLAGLYYGPTAGFMAGLGAGSAFGFLAGVAHGAPSRAGAGSWRRLRFGLLMGVLTILVAILVDWIISFAFGKFELDKAIIHLFPLMVATTLAHARWGLDDSLADAKGAKPPMSPRQVWRNEAGVIRSSGVVFALGSGFLAVAAIAANGGVGSGLVLALVGLPVLLALLGLAGLVIGLLSSVIWPTTLAWLQLRLSRQVPGLGLMNFLEDARERGVLRAAGPAYQFRYAALQDHLIGEARARRPAHRAHH